jgi:hypothetical protein
MKRVFGLIVMFCFYLTPEVAYACKCIHDDPPEAFNKAKVIFIGQMLGGTERLSDYETIDDRIQGVTIEAGTVRFSVEEVFKGNIKNRVTVWVNSHKGTSCGPYGLRRGKRYLVYAYSDEGAYGNERDKTGVGSLYIAGGVCARTARVEYAKKDLDFLRKLPPPGGGGNLSGGIWAGSKGVDSTLLSGLKVRIHGDSGQAITVSTDKGGKFEVKNLRAGKYRVEPELPAKYMSIPKSDEVSIDDGGTATVEFSAYVDGRVVGRLIDKEGRVVNWPSPQIEADGMSDLWDSRNAFSWARDGTFEVVGVAPGKYVLYLGMKNADSREERRFYYPGTFNRKEATAIDVGLGETVEGIQFVLPDGARVRAVEGQVVWADGKPAVDVTVALFHCGSIKPDGFVGVGLRQTETDKQGRFRLEGFADEFCWIEAIGVKRGRVMESPSRKIVMGENPTDIKLVLSRTEGGGRRK